MGGTPEIASDCTVRLDYRFAAENDVVATHDGGFAGYFVARVLREEWGLVVGEEEGERERVRFRCIRL